MKALIFGGTGFIGQELTCELLSHDYEVCVVTRSKSRSQEKVIKGVELMEWDGDTPLSQLDNLQKFDVVVNLAGESIANGRWIESVKQKILHSRVEVTRAIVEAILSRALTPKVLISGSAIGYYGAHGDEILTEEAVAGEDFLASVCKQWEEQAYRGQNELTRVVVIRTGVVLGTQGALTRMVKPFKAHMGGSVGSGTQLLSWVHVKDVVGMIRFSIENTHIIGAVNATAPEPTQMKAFANCIGTVLSSPSWLAVPEFMIKLALGEMSEIVLKGQRVIPEKMLQNGYKFKFPELKSALEDILLKK